MSKLPGPSRIPTFGTRIPQFGAASKSKQDAELRITPADVGRRVTAAGKIGFLRYVGKVHFSNDVWCGIELETDVGKHDGSIDGIRYFTCSRFRGLMTPLSKVAIYNESVTPRIPKSSSSDAVQTHCTNNELIPENPHSNRKIFNAKDDVDLNFKTRKVLCKERTFDKIETPCDLDTNENQLKKNCVLNNNEQNSPIAACGETKRFRNYLENIETQIFSSTPTASTSKVDNGNLLNSGNVETCQELFPITNSCQMFPSTNEKLRNKLKGFKESANFETDFSTLNQESLLVKYNSNCAESKELTSDNQNVRTFIFNSQDEESKRDSLDLDESLGILSVSQMNDELSCMDSFLGVEDMPSEQKNLCRSPFPPSNLERIAQGNATLISDTTINLELTLDTANESKRFQFARLEETPSPEELPLDPIPIIEAEPRSENTKSKTNSFITSITSITSLDTGYQGDGEMSRPGSRGADNSPLTRRPLQRPPTNRRTDAMTDSDFFTESDADNHDDNILRGDRRAQVIDGTLYGVDPQAAADIYVNNRENMDSSGIFTDLESNTRAEELLLDENIDISPSDSSSKTLSENSQNLQGIIPKNNETKTMEVQVESNKRRSNNSSLVKSNTSSSISPRHVQKNDSVTRHKVLKREVQSKVKSSETNVTKVEDRTPKKPPGRWDAVMNKISKCDSKTNFQEVKSRVFNSSNVRQRASPNSANDSKKLSNIRQVNGQKSPNNKTRRIRTRVLSNAVPSKTSIGGSIHSSLSDLSASPQKKTISASKKKDVHQVTQVLTSPRVSPKLSQTAAVNDGKRRIPPSSIDSKGTKKSIFSPKEKKQLSPKENGRSTVKGGRTSPVVRSPTSTRVASKPAPRTAEALAVLVQHLIFNVEAFEVPHLRRQVKKFQQENEELRTAYRRLEEHLSEELQKNAFAFEEERLAWRQEYAQMIENHSMQIKQITIEQKQSEEKLKQEQDLSKLELKIQYEQKLSAFKREFEKLQKTHLESLDILREENEAIREDIDAKNDEIRNANYESLKLKKDYEAKESQLKEQIHFLSKENQKFKQELAACREEISKLEEERTILFEDKRRLLSYGEGKGIGVQEVESLRAVLELKQNEVSDLRKSLAEVTQKADLLKSCQEKVAALQARCEDLQLQLQRKNDCETTLLSENKKLEQSLIEESNQRRNLSLRNEELQWKLKQNKEVITKILEQTSEDVFNKSDHSLSSFNNDRYSSNTSLNISFKNFSPMGRSSMSTEGTIKLRNAKTSVDEDDSPPASPKVKGVVEKSDSVSYVLDLDESPDVVASRLVRRSFRNSLNPKNTPTKSSSNKRLRMKGNPLSQSSSASSLVSSNRVEYNRSRSVSVRNEEHEFEDDLNFSDNSSTPSPYHYSTLKLEDSPKCHKNDDLDYLDDHVLDLTLPELPSELGCTTGIQALPMPKHLAGEAMISESNSEDESTSSSSGQL